jgi:hypothetical protein
VNEEAIAIPRWAAEPQEAIAIPRWAAEPEKIIINNNPSYLIS